MTADPDVAPSLPRVADDAVFVPEQDVRGAPNVVVDGAREEGTVLALSHWPASGTPDALRADTSAEIVTLWTWRQLREWGRSRSTTSTDGSSASGC
jgi:hypothetical protein